MNLAIRLLFIAFCRRLTEGISETENLISYFASRPELSCEATGADFNESYAIFKCPQSCSGGIAYGGNLIGGERFYHSTSQICFAALHADVISDIPGTSTWVSLRRESALQTYDSFTVGSYETKRYTTATSDGGGTDWSFVLAAVDEADQPLRAGNKVSCADKARSFLAKELVAVQCPPGCLPTAKLSTTGRKTNLASNPICQAAIKDSRIDVAGGLVRFLNSVFIGVDIFLYGDLHYNCVTATLEGFAIGKAQDDGSGLYWICADSVTTCYKVYCDNSLSGEKGWMTIQRKSNGSDFYKSWDSYVYGFGDPSTDFWLGLAAIRDFIVTGSYELNITMTDMNGITKYAHYDSFSIGPAIEDYPLYVSGYSGTAGDSLSCSNLAPFSTHDHNTGVHAQLACPEQLRGGWWYTDCGESNLNGEYVSIEKAPNYQSQIPQLYWYSWLFPMKSVEMRMRPKEYSLDYKMLLF